MTPNLTPTTTTEGDELFDAIMIHIEPDLTTAMIGNLETDYVGETSEAHAARMTRYEQAFVQCDHVLEKMNEAGAQQVRKAKEERRAMLRQKEHEVVSADATTAEQNIDSLNA